MTTAEAALASARRIREATMAYAGTDILPGTAEVGAAWSAAVRAGDLEAIARAEDAVLHRWAEAYLVRT
jgi:hypothetical protein